MGGEVLAEALAAGRRYIAYLPTATCGHPEHIPSFEALAAVGVVEDAIRLSPQPEAGLRKALLDALDAFDLWAGVDPVHRSYAIDRHGARMDKFVTLLRAALREPKP